MALRKFGNVLGGETILPKAMNTFSAWHELISASSNGANPNTLSDLSRKFESNVHQKCLFYPPTYFKHWEGKEEFLMIISCVGEVFGPSFKYERQWLSPNGQDWALEFTAEIGTSKLKIEGIDLVKLNELGEITQFSVLARPPNAVAELKKEMMIKVPPKLVALKAKKFFK